MGFLLVWIPAQQLGTRPKYGSWRTPKSTASPTFPEKFPVVLRAQGHASRVSGGPGLDTTGIYASGGQESCASHLFGSLTAQYWAWPTELSVTTSKPRQVVAATCLSFPFHSALLGCEIHENRDEPGLFESLMPSKEIGMWRGSTNV